VRVWLLGRAFNKTEGQGCGGLVWFVSPFAELVV
jgi:hypothetical protein